MHHGGQKNALRGDWLEKVLFFSLLKESGHLKVYFCGEIIPLFIFWLMNEICLDFYFWKKLINM